MLQAPILYDKRDYCTNCLFYCQDYTLTKNCYISVRLIKDLILLIANNSIYISSWLCDTYKVFVH